MKILIAADMEGISGVVHWDHVQPGHSEYARFRRIMTDDVNAAIRGAFHGGATEVVVTDGHSNGRNILVEILDRRARLNTGSFSPFSMVQGIENGVQGAMFVGYHARAGAEKAILDHTWSDVRVMNLWINGKLFGETGLNASVCGHFGTPVIMISGDQTVCAEAEDLLGAIETAVVKVASGRMTAECLPPEAAQQKIEQAAFQAVSRLRKDQMPPPFQVQPPITMVVEFPHSDMADRAMLLPGACRAENRRVEYTAPDMPTIYRAFRSLLSLAN